MFLAMTRTPRQDLTAEKERVEQTFRKNERVEEKG